MRHLALLVSAGATAGLLAATGGGISAAQSPHPQARGVTLTYWTSGLTAPTPEYYWVQATINAFEKAYPGDKVQITNYPGFSQEYTAFNTASVAKNGPDLVQLWTGIYTTGDANFLLPLNNDLSAATKSRLVGLGSMAIDGNPSTHDFYGVAPDIQTYMGYYNKALFAKAGISGVPTTYAQFLADLTALHNHGIQPIVDGGNPWIVATNFAYYMMNTMSTSDVYALSSGKEQWDTPKLLGPLSSYVAVYKKYVNSDFLSNQDPSAAFLDGKAAILWNDGSWDLPNYYQALKGNLGFFYIPQQPKAVSAGDIVAGPGQSVGATNYGKHQALALDFIRTAVQPNIMSVLLKYSSLPAETNVSPSQISNPLDRSLYEEVVAKSKSHQTWPLWDNYQQAAIDNALNKELGLAASGQVSPKEALDEVASIFQSLPPSEK